jgi:hypothetical protein
VTGRQCFEYVMNEYVVVVVVVVVFVEDEMRWGEWGVC